jgi:AAA domain
LLVELIGSTGAGKSTVTAHLLEMLGREGRHAVTSDQFVLRYYGLGLDSFNRQSLRSLLVDLLVFPWFLRFAIGHLRLCCFMVKIARRDIELTWFRLNVLRNIAKQMGLYELLRRRVSADQVVVLDEGLVHQAHSLFVHPTHAPRPEELMRFVRDIPPPDLLVLVEAPKMDVIRRTVERGHPRVPGARIVEVGTFIERAQEVFAQLTELAAARVETVRICNGDRAGAEPGLLRLVTRLNAAAAA